MELLLRIRSENYEKIRKMLKKDEVVSKATLVFKEGSTIGKGDYYCYLTGTSETLDRAKELVKGLVEVVENEEKQEVVKRIKEEEQKAIEGFGKLVK